LTPDIRETQIQMRELPEGFEELLSEMRPKLHRYCARMTGSVFDGEDAVQDALFKAVVARPSVGVLDNPEGWLFRIAHNAALDVLRRRARRTSMETDLGLEMIVASEGLDPNALTTSLRSFMRLPTLPRSTVILKDVLGYSLAEIAAITGASETAAKSALQRGRQRLRAIAAEPEDTAPPDIDGVKQVLLVALVDAFRADDFDAVRAMLSDEVRLELVAKFKRRGNAEVGEYLGRYAAAGKWVFAAGTVEGRTAMLVYDRDVSLAAPAYFVELEFEGGEVVAIRDFLFARYAVEAAAMRTFEVLDAT
jgi:RNA polymerase sigma-70 factor (ECF subfamily)